MGDLLPVNLMRYCIEEGQLPLDIRINKTDHDRTDLSVRDSNGDELLQRNELKVGQIPALTKRDFKHITATCRERHPHNIFYRDPVWSYYFNPPALQDQYADLSKKKERHQYFIIYSSYGDGFEGHAAILWLKRAPGQTPVVENAVGLYSENNSQGTLASIGPPIEGLFRRTVREYRKGLRSHYGPLPHAVSKAIVESKTNKKIFRVDSNVYQATQKRITKGKLKDAYHKQETKSIKECPTYAHSLNKGENILLPLACAEFINPATHLLAEVERTMDAATDPSGSSRYKKDIRSRFLDEGRKNMEASGKGLWSHDFFPATPAILWENIQFHSAYRFVDVDDDFFNYGKTYYQKHDTYTGKRSNGIPHGKGYLVYRTPVRFESAYTVWHAYRGEFKNGYPHGKGVVYLDSPDRNPNKRIEAHFHRGRLHGLATYYDSGGKKYLERNYQQGIVHGQQVSYYPGGQIEALAVFNDGQLIPEESKTFYYDNNLKELVGTEIGATSSKPGAFVYETRHRQYEEGNLAIYGEVALFEFKNGARLFGQWGVTAVGDSPVKDPKKFRRTKLGLSEYDGFYGASTYFYPNGDRVSGHITNGKFSGKGIFVLKEEGHEYTGKKQTIWFGKDGQFKIKLKDGKRKKGPLAHGIGIAKYFRRLGNAFWKPFKFEDPSTLGKINELLTMPFEFLVVFDSPVSDPTRRQMGKVDDYIRENPEVGVFVTVLAAAAQEDSRPPLAMLPPPQSPQKSKPTRLPAGRHVRLIPVYPTIRKDTQGKPSVKKLSADSYRYSLYSFNTLALYQLETDNYVQLSSSIAQIAASLPPNGEAQYDVFYHKRDKRFSHLAPSSNGNAAMFSNTVYSMGSVNIVNFQALSSIDPSKFDAATKKQMVKNLRELRSQPGADQKAIDAAIKKLQ